MTVLAFLEGPGAIDYGRRFSRLRWRRAIDASESLSLRPEDRCAEHIGGEEVWVIVVDDAALPAGRPMARPGPGRILAAESWPVPPVHTLRELEESTDSAPASTERPRGPSALCFRPAEIPAAPTESVAGYLKRLCSNEGLESDPRFAAFVFEDLSARERPELARRIPQSARRLLDVGCGAGGTSSALKRRCPLLAATGIEKNAAAAARAALLLDRVLEEDAGAALSRLASSGETFDAFLFGDVLEHLADPFAVLALARRIARTGATLVASVPNVGHLSIVRDLVLGRFDPAPSGLADAGHLRWFDRRLLAEALEESGWRVNSIEAEPGAPAPEAEEFLTSLASWPDLDRASLRTYQWVAVAVADGGRESDDLSIGSSDDLPRADEPMDR